LLWSIKALAASELINGLAFKKRTRGKIGNYISACTTTVDCLIFTDSEGHDEEFEGDSNFGQDTIPATTVYLTTTKKEGSA